MWVYEFRSALTVPQTAFGVPQCVPTPERHMLITLDTSEMLRSAAGPDFSEEVSTAAFNRDVRRHAALSGDVEGQLLEDILIFLDFGPTNYLNHLYKTIYPVIEGELHSQRLMFGWVPVVVWNGPHPHFEEDVIVEL